MIIEFARELLPADLLFSVGPASAAADRVKILKPGVDLRKTRVCEKVRRRDIYTIYRVASARGWESGGGGARYNADAGSFSAAAAARRSSWAGFVFDFFVKGGYIGPTDGEKERDGISGGSRDRK